jgi:hypothetical protein
LALTELAANENKPLEGFGLFGVIKETGVDDVGLAEFSEFFPYPLYRDEKIAFYKALGDHKLSLLGMLGSTFSLFSSHRRIKDKAITGNMTGEGIRKGGVIIFDKKGAPQYAYEEDFPNEVPLEDILAASNAVKQNKETAS